MTDFKRRALLPGAQAFAAAQRSQFDALVQTGHAVSTAAQTVVGRQVAVLQMTVQDGFAALHATWGAKDVEGSLKTQLEFIASAQGKALALLAEIAEITNKTSQEAFELLRGYVDGSTAVALSSWKKAA